MDVKCLHADVCIYLHKSRKYCLRHVRVPYTFQTNSILGCIFGFYGDNCEEKCTCNLRNTEACNTGDGSCICKPGWQGDDCTLDVNECTVTDTHFCPANSFCENTKGAYRCVCNVGFEKTGLVCIGMISKLNCLCCTFVQLIQ